MKRKFVQFVAFLLALIILPGSSAFAVPWETNQSADTMVRVGLFYDSNALPGANLQNYSGAGSGFRFGFMSGDAFVQLGYTEQEAISMLKAQNVYYTNSLPEGGYGYTDQPLSDVVVGCYHLQLMGSYRTFEEAQATALMVGGFPAWINGEYQVRIGAYPTKEEAVMASIGRPDLTVVGTSSFGITVVITGTTTPIFQFDGDLTGNIELTVKPGLDDMVKTITHFKGYRYYGSFCYSRYGGNLTVVNLVPMNDYINCVISCEMDNSWPVEALKAQAICARSYAETRTGHASSGFDLCNTVCCQAYTGMSRTGANTAQAAEETAGQFLWYNGNVVEAVYHSSDGGATDDCENVWYEALPYLRGVIDPYEALVEDKISNYHWTKTYTGKELQERLALYDYESGEIVNVRITQTTEYGNVYSVELTDRYGKVTTIKKGSVRSVLGIPSIRFTTGDTGEGYYLADGGSVGSYSQIWVMDGNGNLVPMNISSAYAITGSGVETVARDNTPSTNNGTFTFTGTGKGHNLGMSQWGAYAMAMQGYSYIDILNFYFTGIEIY